jgi:hypothetical protein
VNVPPKKGYKAKSLYEPVWVTGMISVKPAAKELYLVDGSANINFGYTIQANHVEAYKK